MMTRMLGESAEPGELGSMALGVRCNSGRLMRLGDVGDPGAPNWPSLSPSDSLAGWRVLPFMARGVGDGARARTSVELPWMLPLIGGNSSRREWDAPSIGNAESLEAGQASSLGPG